LEQTLVGLRVRDVQCDEMWGYVGMKENAKGNLYKNVDTLGDAYTYVAIVWSLVELLGATQC
jgi:hypothetical protein